MFKLRHIFFVVIISLFLLQPAVACECDLEVLESEYAVEHADVVFIGMVHSIEDLEENGRTKVTFRIMKSWKKPLPYFIHLTTAAEEVDCGFLFNLFDTYLVFASGADDNELSTGICTRTHLLHDEDEDLKYVHSVLKGY